MELTSVYIHIPFCKRRCPYCDFVVNVDPQADIDGYLELCYQELSLQRNLLAGRKLGTIYFGGGTPSLAPAQSIDRCIKRIKELFPEDTAEVREITLECNPEDSSLDFPLLLEAGINRLSLGAQSMRDTKLALLGRMHRQDDIRRFVEKSRAAGFTNLSLDIIFGTPGESLEDLASDVEQFLSLDPQHLSAYELTIERGTNFFEQLAQKKFSLPPETQIEEEMLFLDERLGRAGYGHYEISNYAKTGFQSKHNSSYWQQQDYVGLGIGAHSFIGGVRRANVAALKEYRTSIQEQALATAFSEQLTTEQRAHEQLLLGFRTKCGISFDRWNKTVDSQFQEFFKNEIDEFVTNGFCLLTPTTIIPTLRGMMIADSLASRCMSKFALQ